LKHATLFVTVPKISVPLAPPERHAFGRLASLGPRVPDKAARFGLVSHDISASSRAARLDI
jgi:hypothetical protein